MVIPPLIITGLVVAVAIFALLQFGRMKHRIIAIFVILLFLFGFFSFNLVFKNTGFSIKSVSDLEEGIQIYFSWVGSVMSNVKTLTGQAVGMDWKGNTTS